MNIINNHNRSTIGPQSVHNRRWVHHRKGSILIWTVMLGFVLTSVFFFFGMRQRSNIAVQRDTAAIINAKALLESYADYIETLDELSLADLETNGINFDNNSITGTVTNNVDEIKGIVDADDSMEYKFDSSIFIEWNKCEDTLGTPKGDLVIGEIAYEHQTDALPCENYDDVVGPLSVTDPFRIKTLNAPFEFRITGSDLEDNKWHLEISTELEYGKEITIRRSFE